MNNCTCRIFGTSAYTTGEGDKTADAAQKLAAKEGVEGADDPVVAQRAAMAEQKDTDRPPRYTSQTFGRVEILDDKGDALVKGRPADFTNLADESKLKLEAEKVGDGREVSKEDCAIYYADPKLAEKDYAEYLARELKGEKLKPGEEAQADYLRDRLNRVEEAYTELAGKKEKGNKLTDDEERQLKSYEKIHEFHGKYGKILLGLEQKEEKVTDQERQFRMILNGYPGIRARAFEDYEPVPEVM